jgi:CMP/dCMP kinase
MRPNFVKFHDEKDKIMKNSKPKAFIVTIDGPAGSGKSTVSHLLAQRLKLNFLTTGAFYRGLAYLAGKKGVDLKNVQEVASLAHYDHFSVHANVSGTKVTIDDIDVTEELNSEKVALIASQISAYPAVRAALLNLQRAFNGPPGLVAEGRDCGTVVFPDADVKIFLTASLDKRAERRLADEGASTNHEVLKNLTHRDKADSGRKVAPMAKAADAIEIDSSALSVEEVVAKIEAIVKERWKK